MPKRREPPDHFAAQWRIFKRWSQQDLADRLGVSDSTITRLESGESELRPKMLRKMSKIFGVSRAAILEVDPLKTPSETAEILELLPRIDAARRRQAVEILKTFIAEDGEDTSEG